MSETSRGTIEGGGFFVLRPAWTSTRARRVVVCRISSRSRSRRVASRRRWASDGGVWNEGDVELGRACAMRCDATRSIDALARSSSREPDARARDDDGATPLNVCGCR